MATIRQLTTDFTSWGGTLVVNERKIIISPKSVEVKSESVDTGEHFGKVPITLITTLALPKIAFIPSMGYNVMRGARFPESGGGQ